MARDAAAAAQQQLTGCPQDGGVCGSGARRSSRRSRRHGRRSSKEAAQEVDSDAEVMSCSCRLVHSADTSG